MSKTRLLDNIRLRETISARDTVGKCLKSIPQVNVKLGRRNYSEAVDGCDVFLQKDAEDAWSENVNNKEIIRRIETKVQ